MKRSKEVEYGDWSSLTPLEIAQEVLAWEDDRSALNRKYSQILAKEVERLTIESRGESHRHATIARDNANLRAEVERLKAENAALRADAKLGRMVRIPAEHSLFLNHNSEEIFKDRPWAAGFGSFKCVSGPYWGATPEEALAAAGVGEVSKP